MKKLILYSTSGCHLCELALELVKPLLDKDYILEEIDISESDILIERYGIRIPVISRDLDGVEISWPFNQQDFIAFLNQR